MRKKLFLILAATGLVQIALTGFQSCCSSRPGDMCKTISGIRLSVLDNADSIAHDPNGPIPAKATLLKLHLDDSMSYCMRPRQIGLVTTSYAMMCKEYGLSGQIDSFTITSNHDFDSALPAGANLKSLFYIQNENNLLNGGDFNCYLRSSPSDTGTHVFSVYMMMHYINESGQAFERRIFSATTQPVQLIP